jgi:glucose-1-phosphate thymidylyltransferase
MNIIIPMAGRGTRLRPHTLTVPKPLIPVAGKPIVQRLVEDLVRTYNEPIDHIGFIIGDFGTETEEHLLSIAEQAGAEGHIFHQDRPLGTAHAILCAAELLKGHVIVAFADTLFKADFQLNTAHDGIIWTHRVDDPSRFGVVKLNNEGIITEFIEKPDTFISDMAIIGIYYFKDGAYLRNEIQYLIDNDIRDKGEYQVTSALENMKQKGTKFSIASVEEWLDCGNKDVTVYTNQRVLEFMRERGEDMCDTTALMDNTTIIEPCFIGENVILRNAVIGPHVSVGAGTQIENSIVSNSIIQNSSRIQNKIIANSMIGNAVSLKGCAEEYSIGDYSTTE